MKSIFLFFTLLGLVLAKDISTEQIPVDEHWQSFKLEHNKSYPNSFEDFRRMQIFRDNRDLIDEHNLRYAAGKETFTMGLNEFSDWTDKEFKSNMLSRLMHNSLSENADIFWPPENWTIPQSIDWRNYGAVTPVKNQGLCGSCYIFAAVAALETYQFKQTEVLISLSEQNALDCTSGRPYGNLGCCGGWSQHVFDYVLANGLDTEISYPYNGEYHPCSHKNKTVGVRIDGFARVPIGNESALACIVANIGPVASVINVGDNIRHYSDGLYTNTKTSIEYHSVAVVGYGHDPKLGDFWILKNSWGPTWGNKGFFTIPRNVKDNYNIAVQAHFPF